MELDSHALLRINAYEDAFLPVEVKVGWLTSQASMRSRASAMVGSRISQLDDVVRVRALLSIIRSAAPPAAEESTTTPPPPVSSSTTPAVGTTAAAAAAAAAAAQHEKAGKATKRPAQAPSIEGEGAGVLVPMGHMRTDSATEPPPAPADLELFTRMAVAKMKAVLFQLASDKEKKERRGKDVFDVYEGLVTSEALEKAAEAGFPALDVDTILLPKHFRYRTLIAARHRYLVRKLGVLLDMEDGVEGLLELAVDMETLRESLADVDLSAGEVDVEDGEEEEEQRDVQPMRIGSASLAASSLLMSPSSNAAAAAAAAAAASTSGAASGALKAKAIPTLRDTSWDKDVGNDDTTEGETDEESSNGTPEFVHRRTVEVPPSH